MLVLGVGTVAFTTMIMMTTTLVLTLVATVTASTAVNVVLSFRAVAVDAMLAWLIGKNYFAEFLYSCSK